jgi:thioesterase domain-containing protein
MFETIKREEFMFSEFLSEIKEKGIVISFSNGKLNYSGPEQYIDEEMINKLKKYKAKLFKYFWPFDCYNMMPINTEGTKIPFVFLHAGKSIYPLNEFLGKDQPLYGFFDEGSEGEKIKFKNTESFAAEYLSQIKNIIPNGPYLLGGLSFGGILAYEIAIQLQKQGYKVPLLVLGDCEIPYYRKKSDTSKTLVKMAKWAYHLYLDTYYWFYFNLRNIYYNLFTLLKMELPANFRKPYIIWTYLKLAKKYRPTEQYNGKILLMRTECRKPGNIYLGWDNLCKSIEVVTIPGSHSAMYESDESIYIINSKIKEVLQKANEN